MIMPLLVLYSILELEYIKCFLFLYHKCNSENMTNEIELFFIKCNIKLAVKAVENNDYQYQTFAFSHQNRTTNTRKVNFILLILYSKLISYFTKFYFSVIIDKDQKPAWSPAKVEDVTDETLNFYFSPLPPDQDLVL